MAGMTEDVQDPMLDQLIDGIEEKLPEEVKEGYERIVTAGMNILFDDKTHHLLKIGIQKMKAGEQGGVAQGSAKIGAGLIALIRKETKGAIDIPATFPAAIVLTAHVLEFAKSNGLEVDQDVIAEAVKLSVGNVMKMFNITPEKLQDALGKKERGEPLEEGPVPGGAPAPEAGAPLPAAADQGMPPAQGMIQQGVPAVPGGM